MRKVGFIGLGNMGRGMCKNLILKGNQLTVFDINQDAMQSFKGKAALVHSPLEVLKNSEVVFLSLPNSAVVEKIMNEFLNEGVQGKIIVDTSTSYPMSTRSLHAKIKAAGGISSMADAEKFLSLGADRLGTSRIIKLVKNETATGY